MAVGLGHNEDEKNLIKPDNIAAANKAVVATSVLVDSMLERVKQVMLRLDT